MASFTNKKTILGKRLVLNSMTYLFWNKLSYQDFHWLSNKWNKRWYSLFVAICLFPKENQKKLFSLIFYICNYANSYLWSKFSWFFNVNFSQQAKRAIRRARYECEEWVTREKNFYCAPSLARKPAFVLASRPRPRDSTQKEKRGLLRGLKWISLAARKWHTGCPPFILALNYRTWKTETVTIIMYLSSRKASEAILCARLLILKIYFPTTHMLCHTQAVKSISSSMCEFTGTSTRSNRPQDTLLVFWFSLVKADIFLFTVLVTLTLTNSSSLRSMYSEIFRPLLNPRLSKEASVLLWATIDPPFFRLKAEINNRWSVWKMNYFGKGGRLRAVSPLQQSPSRK